MKYLLLTSFSIVITCLSHAQNVGIGTPTPAASAKLEITSTNSGLLIPRVALTMTTAAGPVTAPATSLLVYNTATAADVTPGYYYWNGAAWVRFVTGASTAWNLLGNSGTVAATNFIGTIDGIDFVTRTTNVERMRVTAAGNVGVGVTNPTNKVDISSAARSGTHGTGLPFYATGSVAPGSAGSVGFEFRHDNGTQGIGLGYNTIYATGSNANQDLGLASRGTGNLNFTTNAAQRMIILGSNGNVGVGLTNPAYGLELNGSFGYGNGTAGSYRSRTETRNDAGQIATQSGAFETSGPVNYPAGAVSWWHLLDVRHSNNANNYAMQIAGSFFDQDLYYRKTNNNGAQSWSKILTSTSGWMTTGNAGTVAATNFIGTTDAIDFVTRTSNTERMRVTSAGNVGIGINAPTQKLDVQGGNARINNAFIGDVGHGVSWAGFANSSSANVTGYALLQSTAGDYTLINKQNTGSGHIGFRVGNADVAVITNAGNMGIGTTVPSTRLHVVADGDNIPVIYGQNINSSPGTNSFGVRGECGSTGLGSAGVSGVSINSSQNEIGVLGDYALWGAGVFGMGWAGAYTDMPSSRDYGVFGTVNYSTGTGVYGKNTSLTVGSAYGVYCNGNFAVTGAKSASVPTSQGNQLVFSTESPEVWFEDFGFATLMDGEIHIKLDELFVETVFIDSAHPMHVFLQEQGDCEGMYFIPDADGKGFKVKEKANGHSNIGFSYRIIAHRRFYQDQRFGVDANQPLENNLQNASYQTPTSKNVIDMQKYLDEQKKIKENSNKR